VFNDNLFSQSWNQIVQGALGAQMGPQFQMFGTPQSWSWPTMPIGEQSAQAYQATSVMPAWSPVGSYSVLDADFFSAYKSALSHVAFRVSPALEQQVKELRNKATADGNAVTTAMTNANTAYLAESANGGAFFKAQFPTLAAWLAGPSGKAAWAAYTQASAVVEEDNQTLLTMQKAAMPATLAEAIEATTRPTGNPSEAPTPPGWTKVPDGSGILRWEPDWRIGTTGTEWRAELTTGSVGQFDVQLSAAESSVDFAKSWASGSASYGSWFWSVYANGSWSEMNLTASDSSVTAEISVKSSTLVPVTPGDWYDGGFMRDLAVGSGGTGWTIASPWVAQGGKASLFGENGLMPTRVSGLLAVYQPSFSVTMAKSTFQENQSQFEASGGFKIGPFSIGGEGGSSSSYERDTSGGTKFTATSTSTDPVLIGVTVAFPGGANDGAV
jgi:hypothetical protein